MTRRPTITPAMKLEVLRAYCCYVTCAVCKQSFHVRDVQFDHHHATVFDGPNLASNLRPLCVPCHLAKTKRDIRDNAHVKRQIIDGEIRRGERKPRAKRKIKSRGFDTTLKRRMDGRVERKS